MLWHGECVRFRRLLGGRAGFWLRGSALLLASSGCTEATDVAPEVQVAFQIRPVQVRAGEGFTTTASFTNLGSDTLAVVSGSTCFAEIEIHHGREPVSLDGSESQCLAKVTRFHIAPGDTVTTDFPLTAWERRSVSPYDYAAPPVPGRYTVFFHSPSPLPELRAEFEIAPSGYYWGWGRCGLEQAPTSDSVTVVIDSVGTHIWYRLWNFTNAVVTARASGGSRQAGDNAVDAFVDVKTANGWESHSSNFAPFSHEVVLFINGCVRSLQGAPIDPGIYRLRIKHDAGFVASDSIVITG